MDQEHQRNKPNKGHSEKTELNNGGLRSEEQYLKASIFGRIYQHCASYEQTAFILNYHHATTPDKKQTTREYAKTLYPSSF